MCFFDQVGRDLESDACKLLRVRIGISLAGYLGSATQAILVVCCDKSIPSEERNI